MSLTAAPPRIDPRIRERRIAVERDRGRRRLRKLVTGLVILAVVAGTWGITRSALLDVDHVRVVGAGHTGEQAVIVASGIHHGDALLTAPVGRAARRIATLPWVQTVRVGRSWPGTVVITVVERTAAAAVPAQGGQWLLVDAQSRQLQLVKDAGPKLVRIDTAPVVPKLGSELTGRTATVLEVAASIPDALHDQIVALRSASGDTVEGTVRLRNGTEASLKFGAPTQIPAKWLALLSVLDQVDPAHIAGIDIRVPASPALTSR